MITNFSVLNPAWTTLVRRYGILEPNPDHLARVAWIEGLDPVKVDLISSDHALRPGGAVHYAKVPKRPITITFNPRPSLSPSRIREFRNELYSLFPMGEEVGLRFEDDDGEWYHINGHVEDIIAPMFTKDPALQVSFLCEDPTLYGLHKESEYWGGSGYFSVEGEVSSHVYIRLEVTANTRPNAVLRVGNPAAQEWIYLNTAKLPFDGQIRVGDVIEINSKFDRRYARLTRGLHTDSIYGAMDLLTRVTNWPTIRPGVSNNAIWVRDMENPSQNEGRMKIFVRYREAFAGL